MIKEQLEKTDTGRWKVRRDTPLAQHTISKLRESWGVTGEYFPGPQPVSIERKHLSHLKRHAYVVCEKSDGVRHVCMAFMYEGTKMCVLVNRAFDIVLASLSLPKFAYQGTILDGELVDGLFLVYDAIYVSGASVMTQNLIQRLEAANTVVSATLKLSQDPFVLRMKTFFDVRSIEEFQTTYVPTLTYKIDGLVFTPVDEPVRTGTHETLFKWKPRDLNTIDFLAKRSPSKWSLYVQEKGLLVFESELALHEAPEWMTDGCIVECQYMVNDEPRWWKPLSLRRDKVHPNNRRTFYNTLTNIREDIQLMEFVYLYKAK